MIESMAAAFFAPSRTVFAEHLFRFARRSGSARSCGHNRHSSLPEEDSSLDAVIGGQAIYFALLVIIRLSGRRTLGQMTPFDLVTILAISETTQQAILGDMTLRSFAKSILYLGTNPDTRRESSIYLSNSGLEGIDTHRADYIALDLQTHSRILLKQIRFGRIQPHNLSGFDSKLVGLEKFKLPWMMSDHDPVSDLRQPHGEELSS